MTRPIRRLLIANRGEIVVRIARTCRRLGIDTVGVFSDVDADALHPSACDEALRIGGASASESYLRPEALVDAARRTGADAVHPGYGFLSENPGFAQAVIDAGLVWVGPRPDVISAMGDKVAAKARMAAAGVPVLPGAVVDDDADLDRVAGDVGYPLMVKPAAGGGGKGMRVVAAPEALRDAVAVARREAASAFGDDRVFLERYVARPRHLEVQVLGDEHGAIVHLAERECSIQRRHQKVIEECPAPGVDPALRSDLGAAAIAAAKAIGYTNAGTVEFIAETAGDGTSITGFAFLEMNTRLQVEHPVTEAVTGHDLVALQLAVAAGAPLPFTQDDLALDGHAIEARLYAEDPASGYLPATGTIHAFAPARVEGVRYDVGIRSGDAVGPQYDPMLAKVIAHGETRAVAARRLRRALQRTVVHGIATNRDLLVAILDDDRFLAGETTTAFLDERFPNDDDRSFEPAPGLVERAAVAVTALAAHGRRSASGLPSVPAGFTNDPHARWYVAYRHGRRQVEVWYRARRGGGFHVWVDAAAEPRTVHVLGDAVEIDGHRTPVAWLPTRDGHHVVLPQGQVTLTEVPRFPVHEHDDVAGAYRAPMPGTVVTVGVEVGQQVAPGDVLVTLEAMKMEHRLSAHARGVVTAIHAAAGDQVDADALLVVVDDATAQDQDGSEP